MRDVIEGMLERYESGSVSRRELVLALAGLALVPARGDAQARRAALEPAGINHVTMFVADRERSVEFYQRIFGMPVQSLQQGGTNLAVGNGRQFLGIFQAGTRQPVIDHVCLAVRDFDVDRIRETLREHGVDARVRMRGEVPEIYFNDPDGLSIQLQHERYCGGSGVLGDDCG